MDWRDWDALHNAHSREATLSLGYGVGTAKKGWAVGLPLAALLLFLVLLGCLLFLQPPRYSAETRILIGPRAASLIGLRSSHAFYGGANGASAAAGQAQLIASRDLARRAIKALHFEELPEFDAAAQDQGPVTRVLIFLGIERDPARKSREDRVLEAYQDRLQVSAPGRGSLVTIAFQSEDPELAARAANRIAELYLEMRADANVLPANDGARIVSRAITPTRPLDPKQPLLLLSGAAMLVIAFGSAVLMVSMGRGLTARVEEPVAQPRTLGQERIFTHLRVPAKVWSRPGREWAPLPLGRARLDESGDESATAEIVAHILSAPLPGSRAGGAKRGKRVVATSLGPAAAASGMMRDLARDLAREGCSLVIGLDESSLFDVRRPSAGVPQGCVAAGEPPGLCDLLDGTASFDEVIRREPASRLHCLRVGRGDELKLPEFMAVLDALTETYDFLLMIAPPLGHDGIAETLAAKADFAVLAVPARPQGGSVFEAESRLLEAGAREVLLIGLPAEPPHALGRDAA